MMKHHEAFVALCDVLAELYPDLGNAHRLARSAGLDIARPLNTWHAVVQEAQLQGQLEALMALITSEYPTNEPLALAVQAYQQLVTTPPAPTSTAASANAAPVPGLVFLSYSRENRDYVEILAADLERRGFAIWYDDRIDLGRRWWRIIEKQIETCAAMVVVMSPEAGESEWVEREILLAQQERKPILPLLLRGYGLPLLINKQYTDVRGWQLPPNAFYIRLHRAILTPEADPPAVTAPMPHGVTIQGGLRPPTSAAASAPSAEPRLTTSHKMALVEALLGCAVMTDYQSRSAVVDYLPAAVKHSIRRSGQSHTDVSAIVNAALHYPNGLARLIDVVRFFEGDSFDMRTVDKALMAITKYDDPPSEYRRRSIDAAMPQRIPLEKSTELLVQVCHLESGCLKAILQTDSEYLTTPDDIKSKEFILEFPVNARGKLQSVGLLLKVTAREFDPPMQEKKINILPDSDSEVVIFQMTPKLIGNLRVLLEVYQVDMVSVAKSLSVLCEPAAVPALPQQRYTVITIPVLVMMSSIVQLPTPQSAPPQPHSIHAPAPRPMTRGAASRSRFPVWLPITLGFLCVALAVVPGIYLNQQMSLTNAATATAAAQVATATAATWNKQTATAIAATAMWIPGDDDRDGLSNQQELELNTMPNNRDTDGDGLIDGVEVNERGTNPLDDDTDDDGWKDGFEVEKGTDPLKQDTDGDGLADPVDPDPLHWPTLTLTTVPTWTPTLRPIDTPMPTNTPR